MYIVSDIWDTCIHSCVRPASFPRIAKTCRLFRDLCTEGLVVFLHNTLDCKQTASALLSIRPWSEYAKHLLVEQIEQYILTPPTNLFLSLFQADDTRHIEIVYLIRLWVHCLFLRCPGSSYYYKSNPLLSSFYKNTKLDQLIGSSGGMIPKFMFINTIFGDDNKNDSRDKKVNLKEEIELFERSPTFDVLLQTVMSHSVLDRMLNQLFYGWTYWSITINIAKCKTLSQMLAVLTYIHDDRDLVTGDDGERFALNPFRISLMFLTPPVLRQIIDDNVSNISNDYSDVPEFMTLFEENEKEEKEDLFAYIISCMPVPENEKQQYSQYLEWITENNQRQQNILRQLRNLNADQLMNDNLININDLHNDDNPL